ncbi:MAG: helix-turn-helix domain-containing protein [Enhygromyxa sp.]
MSTAERQTYTDLLLEVQPHPIRTKADYRRQLEWLEHLMGQPTTRDTSMMIEMLSITLAAYESSQFPIADAAPEVVLDHLIENCDQTASSIARALGISPGTLSNYRTGRRKLTVDSIIELAQYFGVDPRVFLGKRGEPLDVVARAAGGAARRRVDRIKVASGLRDEQVLAVLQELGGERVSAADIRGRLDVTPVQLRASLNRLIESGHVVFEGKARGTRFSLVE